MILGMGIVGGIANAGPIQEVDSVDEDDATGEEVSVEELDASDLESKKSQVRILIDT